MLCSSSSRPSPISRQWRSDTICDEPVAVHRLDHEPAALAQDAADRRQRPRVLLVAQVAERRVEVQSGVEAVVLERQLAVVGADELRPALAAGAPARLVEQDRRAVDAGDAVAGARERDRVAAEPARRVEQLAAVRAAGQPGGGERLLPGLGVALVVRVRAQVEVAEERVPGFGRARRHAGESRSTADLDVARAGVGAQEPGALRVGRRSRRPRSRWRCRRRRCRSRARAGRRSARRRTTCRRRRSRGETRKCEVDVAGPGVRAYGTSSAGRRRRRRRRRCRGPGGR